MSAETTEPAAADAAAAPLDLLLTDAALGVLNRVVPDGSGLRLAAALAARPRLVAGRTRNLLGELARIAAGTSQVQPSRRDRRFADPGWAGNPLLRRAMQAYLAAAQTAEGLAQDADLDWSDTERVGFMLHNLIDALAPGNNPVLNPAALKAAIDTGGGSAPERPSSLGSGRAGYFHLLTARPPYRPGPRSRWRRGRLSSVRRLAACPALLRGRAAPQRPVRVRLGLRRGGLPGWLYVAHRGRQRPCAPRAQARRTALAEAECRLLALPDLVGIC